MPSERQINTRNITCTLSITSFWSFPMYPWVFWYHWRAFGMLIRMSSEPLSRVSGNLSANGMTHECSGVRLFECSCNLWACSISHLERGTNDSSKIVLIKTTYRAHPFPPEPVPINRKTIGTHWCKIRHTTTRVGWRFAKQSWAVCHALGWTTLTSCRIDCNSVCLITMRHAATRAGSFSTIQYSGWCAVSGSTRTW